MNNQNAIKILRAFFLGAEDMAQISYRTRASRDEVRDVLRGARQCGLIEYSTQGPKETLNNVRKKKLGDYLRTKGAIK